MHVKDEISSKLESIVIALVKGNYQEVLDKGVDNRLQVDWIRKAVHDYPVQLTFPPKSSYKNFDFYAVDGKEEWIVEFFLWADYVPSDLMIKLIFFRKKSTLYYNLYDIYVP